MRAPPDFHALGGGSPAISNTDKSLSEKNDES